MQVNVTPEQEAQIRLLSDGELYRDAMNFVHESLIVDNKQMAGLLEYSRSWDELKRQSRQYADQFAGLLAHEFIQHLVAEMMWKEAKLP